MKKAVISIGESNTVYIPDVDIWMSEMELVELFG